MDARDPAALIDLARGDLHSALALAAGSGTGSLAACSGSLARSVQRLEDAVAGLATGSGARRSDAQRALEHFRAALDTYAALHASAGAFCAEWARNLASLGGQAYSPPGGRGLPLPAAGRRVSIEA